MCEAIIDSKDRNIIILDKHSKNIEDGQRKIFLFEITDSQSLDPEYFIDKF